jgi:polar amino acid transport system substrate-binding protein
MNIRFMSLGVCITLIGWGGLCAGCAKAPSQSDNLTVENGVLTVGMAIEYPPLEYYDDDGKTPIGFDVELAKALADKLGLKVKYVDTAWDGIFAGLNTGKYDAVISGVTITPDRLGAHNFTKPYIGNAMTIVLLKDSPIAIEKPEDIAGYRVSYQQETTADIYAARMAGQGVSFTPFEYDTIMHCFDELRLKRVDIIIVDSLVASRYISSEDSLFEIVWQGPAEEKFGVCLKKGNDALTAALDKALDELFAGGVMARLSQTIFQQDLVSQSRN